MKPVCSVEGCSNRAKARGWCGKHYMRWYVNGAPEKVAFQRAREGDPAMFLNSLPSSGEGCIFWPYAKNNQGYGQINTGAGKKKLAHRVVCEQANGPAPSKDYVACHSCGNGHLGCVAPWHLSWKTLKENSADRVLHGTDLRGEDAPVSKLTESDVSAIIALEGVMTQSQIATLFGVSQTAISKILRGVIWAHVTKRAAAE